jgi:hypothetical protein
MEEIIDHSYPLIKPYIEKAKAKSYAIKNEVYNQLNDYEKALFSFHVYYQHAKKDFTTFLFYTNEFIRIGFWQEIVKGLEYYRNIEAKEYFEKVQREVDNEVEIEGLKEIYTSFFQICQNHLLKVNEILISVKRNRKQ